MIQFFEHPNIKALPLNFLPSETIFRILYCNSFWELLYAFWIPHYTRLPFQQTKKQRKLHSTMVRIIVEYPLN